MSIDITPAVQHSVTLIGEKITLKPLNVKNLSAIIQSVQDIQSQQRSLAFMACRAILCARCLADTHIEILQERLIIQQVHRFLATTILCAVNNNVSVVKR